MFVYVLYFRTTTTSQSGTITNNAVLAVYLAQAAAMRAVSKCVDGLSNLYLVDDETPFSTHEVIYGGRVTFKTSGHHAGDLLLERHKVEGSPIEALAECADE